MKGSWAVATQVRGKPVCTVAPWGEAVWILCGSCVDSALGLPPLLRVQSTSEMDGRQIASMVQDLRPFCGAEW